MAKRSRRKLATASPVELKPKTIAQNGLLKSMRDNIVTFAIGPAGTGKTFLATSFALKCLVEEKWCEKIVVVRPAVEAGGEKLGYLPGELENKMEPYLNPIYDAVKLHFGEHSVMDMIDDGVIEVCPLGYMRGRTMRNCVVVLDEAQNATDEQVEMFLTRLGENCKMVLCGDVTQNDLKGKSVGIVTAAHLFKNFDGMNTVLFSESDSVRHPMLAQIILQYKEYKNSKHDQEKVDISIHQFA